MESQKSLYFPGLNGIRALAATIVMVFHTDQWSKYFNLPSLGFWESKMQTYAVVMFFVLSGFLITYLLLIEKERQGKIDFRKFYLRRILRIWPVYYLVLFVGSVLLAAYGNDIDLGPKPNLPLAIAMYGAFLPNIAFFLGYCPDLIGILWSVGVEEQFYLFWPLLVNTTKFLKQRLLLFLALFTGFRVLVGLGVINLGFANATGIFFFLPFDCMAIGGLAALSVKTGASFLKLIYHPLTQVVAFIFLAYSIFVTPIKLPFISGFDRQLHALVYAVIILNVSTNPATLISFENKIFNFIGKISYGIYAYHFIILFLLSRMLNNALPLLPFPVGYGLMMLAEISATILVAYFSYQYFEKWFLKRKELFVVVQSNHQKVDKLPGAQVELEARSAEKVS